MLSFRHTKKTSKNIADTTFKGIQMVFKAFESGIFSKLKESEQLGQLNDDLKYNSFSYDKKVLI